MIDKYVHRVESKLSEFLWLIKHKQISIEKISDEMLIIRGRIVFIDESIVDFRELVTSKEIDYRYQYMTRAKKMIKRWDTAPHHPQIPTHPYHVHDGNEIKSSPKMNFIKVMDAVSKMVIDNLIKEK